MLYNKPPVLDHVRVLGCLCYVHNQKHGGDKFAPRGTKSVFLGYPFGKKGWKVYDLETGIVSTSRDVIFIETDFSFPLKSSSHGSDLPPQTSSRVFDDDEFMSQPHPPALPVPLDTGSSPI